LKRVLLAGGSHSDIPFIEALHRLGSYVITSGNRASDYGHQFADATHLEDFSDQEAMLALARRLRIDAICPSANDFSMISCAYVAEQMRLPGYDSYETTLTLHHKDRFRSLAQTLELSCPKARHFDTSHITIADIRDLDWPLIVKPIDLTGGKGITRIDNPDELSQATNYAFDYSRAKRIVVEEFFAGSLHSYSTLIRDQKIIFEYSDNEFSFLNPYTVSTSTTPVSVSADILAVMHRETEKLARALKLTDGILHGQFLTSDNELRIIEFTRRPPGDLYTVPVWRATHINSADLAILPFLGLPIPTPNPEHNPVFFSRHCLMADRNGIFTGYEIAPEIKNNIVDQIITGKPGQHVDNYLNERLGVFFIQYESKTEMENKTARINQLIRPSISEG
jgi:biotin carboxylase